MADLIMQVSGVSKNYGRHRILKNISLDIPKGSVYGLVGRNGAGKTTLMRVMTGLQRPDSGTIQINTEKKGVGAVGAIVEMPSIYPNVSAYQNLVYQHINLGFQINDDTKTYINELLKFVGLAETGNKKAGKFSLGMRQRLGVAMAMVGDPELLILDEPINGLDPEGILDVRNLIVKLNSERGITIVISSHILSELSKLATQYAFMENGEVIKQISAHEIETAGRPKTLVAADKIPELQNILSAKGLNSTLTSDGKLEVDGQISLMELASVAGSEGIEILSATPVETDLEKFFVDLVGGQQ